jgi:hypothetical protein
VLGLLLLQSLSHASARAAPLYLSGWARTSGTRMIDDRPRATAQQVEVKVYEAAIDQAARITDHMSGK